VYLQSDADIFKTDAVPEATTVDYSGIHHPPVFQAVAKFLYQTAINEIGKGEQEAFTRWRGRAPEFDEQFASEIRRYARQQYPYNDSIRKGETISEWWKKLEGSAGAEILPVSPFFCSNE
jgi:hypothetical protein